MENDTKLVDFAEYCPTCKYSKNDESEPPCDDCLEVPARMNSHKPEKWEAKE